MSAKRKSYSADFKAKLMKFKRERKLLKPLHKVIYFFIPIVNIYKVQEI